MPPKINPTPLASLRVSRYSIPAHGLIPNTSIQNKPLIHYHEAFPVATLTASSVESHLTSVGVVEPQWRFTMYNTTHFHSTTHELLCITRGKARLCFGGEDNPDRVEKEVEQGDVLVLPAGVGHRLLEDLTGGFEMVGSYPKGCSWDMCYGKKGEEAKVQSISKLPWFERDPIYGEEGPVLEV
ncbi:RmlC-like cupin domain-containing protein [Hypoxylon rubiginosum]|uniref:RmlC-like cupin domain-containing protein n=1 Tax=Hypoxylon rubiginosum TaxID=110542 RepID=A0ACC0CJ28_9PEZI|nr:RmlC-like cupin domain-containing protein [Hypoxylon rubiginosum]